MVLACSRHMFVRPVLVMDQRAWTECHVAAFAFFGGVPARLVPDNLKTGVDKPDLYDPKINRSYAELAAHYGCLIDPARAIKPRDKARVERPMPYVRDCFWRGREFTSLAQMQAEAERWSAGRRRAAGVPAAGRRRPGRGVRGRGETGAAAAARRAVRAGHLGAGEDRPGHPRPGRPVLYSVPWQHIGKTADVRLTATMVQFFIGGQLVKTHPRKARGKPTDFGDYPPEKIAFHMRTPAWCRKQAAGIGLACEQVIAELLAENALYRLRAAQGVIGLADKHDPGRLEAACAAAITAGDPSYRTVKGILAAGTETAPAAAAPGTAGGGVPARPGVIRECHPAARHDHQRRGPPARHHAGSHHDIAASALGTDAAARLPAPLAAQAHALIAPPPSFIERPASPACPSDRRDETDHHPGARARWRPGEPRRRGHPPGRLRRIAA